MAERRRAARDCGEREGGPLTEAYLPYGRQDISAEDAARVGEALRADLITQGPCVAEFEEAVARYLGARHVVAFANGTAALHGAASAAGLRPGEEAITTPLGFAASANCVLYHGALPRFVDISSSTWNLDMELAAAAASDDTRAVIPVSFAGLPVDLTPLDPIRDRVVVIEDAAHALGARRGPGMVGGPRGADMTTFSLHPVKAITTGEGGLVSTERDDLAARLRLFRTHGITKDGVTRSTTDGEWYYEMQALGFNYRITDFQCVLGLSQLERLDEFVTRRNRVAERYRELLVDEPRIALPPEASPGDLHAYHLFVVGVKGGPGVRLAVFDALRKAGIGVQVHYIPIYRHPYYRDVVGSPQDECPMAEEYYAGAISLPMFPGLSRTDVDRVVAELQRVLP